MKLNGHYGLRHNSYRHGVGECHKTISNALKSASALEDNRDQRPLVSHLQSAETFLITMERASS